MQIRRIAIRTVDGLSPMPVSSAWVRDGIFVIGMDSEFAVYSQWRDDNCVKFEVDTIDGRHLQEADLLNIAQVQVLKPLKKDDYLHLIHHPFCCMKLKSEKYPATKISLV